MAYAFEYAQLATVALLILLLSIVSFNDVWWRATLLRLCMHGLALTMFVDALRRLGVL